MYRFLFDAIIQCRNLGVELERDQEFYRAKGLQAFQHGALLYEHAAELSSAERKEQFSAYCKEPKIEENLQKNGIDVEDLFNSELALKLRAK